MLKLGKNRDGYRGETIDIAGVLRAVELAALANDWTIDRLAVPGDAPLMALRRESATAKRRLYLSTGIHGDEPAGPLAVLQLLRDDEWPSHLSVWLCPFLNPRGFAAGRRENPDGVDLNRDYRLPQTAEIQAHVNWLKQQPGFDLTLCLHEDWEAKGFYVYELNPEGRPSHAAEIITAVATVCPIDDSPMIENRVAKDGVIRPDLDPAKRPQWPEAFYLIMNKTRQCYTLEAPSDYPLPVRVSALVAAVRIAVKLIV